MISTLKIIESRQVIPWHNIALEHCLTQQVGETECILFLWQNRNTVVIGKNQNAFQECNVELLAKEHGYLARRYSGGGAVYHDDGNLNFSFITKKENYDAEKQSETVLRAVRKLGIEAERTGRNDIEVDGRKFSGSAFYGIPEGFCHHGTIMMDVDGQKLSRYLRVPTDKLKSKGIASVRSRVVNLREYNPGVTTGQLCGYLRQSFREVYGLKAEPYDRDLLSREQIEKEASFLASEEWLYRKQIPFTYAFYRRFSWGGIRIELQVRRDVVEDAVCWSDAMDAELISMVQERLRGCRYRSGELIRALHEGYADPPQELEDISAMIYEEMTGSTG